MSCLNTFYISHFEEKEMYSKMAEVGLQLDKVDFAVNGYEVDEGKYPRQGPKEPSTSRRKKMKVGEALTIDLSEEESTESNQENEFVQLGQEDTSLQLVSLHASNEEEEEELHSEGQLVPLMRSRLGVVNIDENENKDLARVRFQATPQKLFISMSPPSPFDQRREGRPSISTPLPPLNPPNPRRNKRIAESIDRRRPSAANDPETPQLVASQASVSEFPDPPINMVQMMMNFM